MVQSWRLDGDNDETSCKLYKASFADAAARAHGMVRWSPGRSFVGRVSSHSRRKSTGSAPAARVNTAGAVSGIVRMDLATPTPLG